MSEDELKALVEQLTIERNQYREENESYKELIENLKGLSLYDYDLDYDYEENPIDNYYSFDMKYYIDNWFKCDQLDKAKEEQCKKSY
jgi:hypothetical protein